MIVSIQCPRCQARTIIHMIGNVWDLSNVKHTCDPSGGSQSGSETFDVRFDPPRRPF